MPEAADNGGRYRVHCSSVIAQRIKDLQAQANAEGRGKAFLDALRTIGRHLIYDPNDFGEPLYRLPALRMQVRLSLVLPLVADFAVCEDRPLVFIKGIRLLPKKRA